MAKKLSKISKELKVGISVIANFLNNNGYDCEENPNEKIPEEAIEFLRNNISAYLQESKADGQTQNVQDKSAEDFTFETPVEIKLIDCVSKHKMLIENIIGFTDYNWNYSVAQFHGTCSQPVKFSVFDEVISKILLIKEMSLTEIGKVLGFNVADEAEKNILLSAIADLKSDKMLDGDESYYWLTDTGKQYAKNGVKFSTFERDFELYIDSTTGFTGNCKKVFERLKSQKQDQFVKDNLPNNIEDVKPLAEIQAPEIHFPEKNYILQSCKPTGIEGYTAQVWVVLLENFREQTVRALVYDESRDCIVDELSEALDTNEELKQSILEKLIEKDKDNNEGISYTNEDKNIAQIDIETSLISEQEAYDNALNENNLTKAEQIVNNVVSTKRHFNSVEFEVELKRLFEDTKCDLWIISPWIKKYATMHRIPFFEQYLKKGGRIFIAYSKPENGVDVMADSEALEKLEELERKYQNFYITQMDPFHFKYVWVRGAAEGDWFYSGSFNILSFFVKKGLTKVRQEMMTKLDWGDEEDNYFKKVLSLFGNKYLEQSRNSINIIKLNGVQIDRKLLQEIKALNLNKLKPFMGTIGNRYDDEISELQKKKDEMYWQAKSDFLRSELEEISTIVQKYATDANLSVEKKRDVQAKLNVIKNEYPDNLEDIEPVQVQIENLKVHDLSRLSKPRNFNNYNKGKYKKKR